MKINVGGLDKVIRAIIGIAAAAYAFFGLGSSGTLAIILYVVAAAMIVTAATGFCGLYTVFGISTCKVNPGSDAA